MNLQSIIKGLAISDRRGRFDAEVTGITADSRTVRPGDVFVAVRGTQQDGHRFIQDAVDRGAAAVIAEAWPFEGEGPAQRPDVVLVPNSRRALGLAAANFFGQPSRKLHVAGVTGTNGKTTVTYVLESIIRAAGRKVGVIGSVEARFDRQTLSLGHTTPGAVDLQRTLAAMVDAGVSHAVMEVSSHALDQQRTAGVHFKVAGFTNLTQDHLDYHKSMETYFEAKARLFSDGLKRSRARGRMAVINIDDPRGSELLERWGGKSLRVSLDPHSDADVVVLDARYALTGTEARIRTSKGEWSIRTALIGAHNLSNVCVAVGMALAMGFSKVRILRGLEALERVPGRLERVPDGRGRRVLVDYAHSPDALAKVLEAVRPHCEGRLVVVFGAGGDRDAEKRGPMGEVVGRWADIAFVTSDNPRGEPPEAIAEGLAQGLEQAGRRRVFVHAEEAARARMESGTFVVDLDRQRAVHGAVAQLDPKDVLLIAGKGHEAIQVIGERRYRFDDREVARRALEGLPIAELETLPPADGLGPAPRGETQSIRVEDVVEEASEVERGAPDATEGDA